MAALTQAKIWDHKGSAPPEEIVVGVAGTYRQGAVVVYLAAGKITNVPASGLKPAGIIAETVVISSDDVTAGKKVKVHTAGWWLLPYASAAQTDEGELVYINASAGSDNPADLRAQGAGTTGDVAFGRVKKFVSSSAGGWIDITDRAAIATHS